MGIPRPQMTWAERCHFNGKPERFWNTLKSMLDVYPQNCYNTHIDILRRGIIHLILLPPMQTYKQGIS